ncbi:Hypothetical predicted protein, partial [Lynx pardinus]
MHAIGVALDYGVPPAAPPTPARQLGATTPPLHLGTLSRPSARGGRSEDTAAQKEPTRGDQGAGGQSPRGAGTPGREPRGGQQEPPRSGQALPGQLAGSLLGWSLVVLPPRNQSPQGQGS